tara:strand:- start:345 stop:518 length:174 start_codon:yes stop_codon:yes gene_type:complete
MVAEIRKSVREKTAKKGRKTKRGREEFILIKKIKNKPLQGRFSFLPPLSLGFEVVQN